MIAQARTAAPGARERPVIEETLPRPGEPAALRIELSHRHGARDRGRLAGEDLGHHDDPLSLHQAARALDGDRLLQERGEVDRACEPIGRWAEAHLRLAVESLAVLSLADHIAHVFRRATPAGVVHAEQPPLDELVLLMHRELHEVLLPAAAVVDQVQRRDFALGEPVVERAQPAHGARQIAAVECALLLQPRLMVLVDQIAGRRNHLALRQPRAVAPCPDLGVVQATVRTHGVEQRCVLGFHRYARNSLRQSRHLEVVGH
ncbi:hypothetical protein [uncultured Methylibium sp.]|uniref:hypothetical protein n=1 Tax=uncultured Methylibium sp. TaxID=381093 RepID=UPI0025EF85C9|nr:hypothetical protein [uncultured Methylibium sp.]